MRMKSAPLILVHDRTAAGKGKKPRCKDKPMDAEINGGRADTPVRYEMKGKLMKKLATIIATCILIAAPSAFAGGSDSDGPAIYKAKCAMCHGPDGAGQTPMGKNLKLRSLGAADVQKQTDADLTKVIADGKGKMPAYKGKLTPADIDAVLDFIRTMKK